MEAIAIFIVCILFVVIGGVGLCGWAVYAIIHGIVRAASPKPRLVPISQPAPQICGNAQCRCSNPAHARFCRRCGKSLPSLLRAVSSRVAML
jgi:hypothetical protein